MPAELTFRRARMADVAAVVALVESAYRGQASKAGWTTEADLLDGRRTDAAAVTAIVTAPQSRLLLALLDDGGLDDGGLDDGGGGRQLVACCQLKLLRDGAAYFGMFAVRPLRQGAGIGSRSLAEAERRARLAWSATAMEMTVIAQRSELIAWYARRGYHPTGETRPFPYGDERFGAPRRPDLRFVVLAKALR